MKYSTLLYFSLALFLATVKTALSQDSTSSSLSNYESAADIEKIKIGPKIIHTVAENDIEKAEEMAKEIYSITKSTDNKELVATANEQIGIFYANKGDHTLALSFLNKASLFSKNNGSAEKQLFLENTIADVFIQKGNYVNAIQRLYKADSLANAVNYKGILAFKTAISLAQALGEIGLYELSNEYFTLVVESDVASSKKTVALYQLLNNAIEQDKLFTATSHYKKIEADTTLANPRISNTELSIRLKYFAISGNQQQATSALDILASNLYAVSNAYERLQILLNISRATFTLQDFSKAIFYANAAMKIAQAKGNLLLQKKATNLALLASTKGKPENAYTLALKLDSLDKALAKETGLDILRIVRLQKAFGTMLSFEKKMDKLKVEKNIESKGRTKAEKIGIMLAVAIFMLVALLFMSIRQMKKRQKDLEAQKKRIKEKSERQRKAHIEKIKEKDNLLDLVYSKSRDLTLLFKVEKDDQLIVYSLNQALDRINKKHQLNLKKDAFIGKSLKEIVEEFPYFNKSSFELKQKAVKQVIHSNTTQIFETTANINKQSVDIRVYMEPVENEKTHRVDYVLYTLRDISGDVKHKG